MNREQAKKLIRETFESSFDKKKFTIFIKNLLNKLDETKAFHARGYVKHPFKQVSKVIKTYERIGSYTDSQNNKIDVLIVYLEMRSSLDRARTTMRNFVARYLKDRGEKDAALVAFVSPDKEDWRFSLVKMDYRFEKGKGGKLKIKKDFTAARRWSFLVGKNEKSHTAQSRLVPILEDDEHDPTLAQLEEAFNIEPVTKEFFEKYRDLLIRTVDELDKLTQTFLSVKKEFEAKNINTVDFAKKLLGQIVFLYFLQKKGWFDVERDAARGTGPKDFLRRLFNKEYGDYNNFFNDILEPLFYEALARERDDNFYSRFNCKIPFLNGGLFEPIGGYNWIHTDINLPDELFSNNNKTPEGDKGDGILDVFDRFNFTVKEDEPLEKEVAIDPELLGRLYEKFNAIRPDNFYEYKKALASGKKSLEKKFNKKFGVYYTPREIVHYMCQQSLIYYLKGSTDIPVCDLEKLIKFGEQYTENESTVLEKGKETSSYKYKLPETIRKNAKLIDDKLKDIKVCDPAVGSGAFPVGMMHEIVKARNVLSVFIESNTGIPAQGNTDIPACGDHCNTGIPACGDDCNTGIPACDNITITRRNLPHWTRSDSIYWVTFRLADSLPQEKINQWKNEYDSWLKQNPKPWDNKKWQEYNNRFGIRLEKWLDSGYGSCILADSKVREIVRECILRFNGERLRIHSMVIMPNHVHMLIEPMSGYSISRLLKGMKGASAREINKFLKKTGNKVWMEESYDHIVRSEDQYYHFVKYINENPIKANLPENRYWIYQSQSNTGIHAQGNTDIPVCGDHCNTGIPACENERVNTQTRMSVLHSTYNFKRECIENSLYGVDIDPGAVEVAKLRLWLSLIVDEEDIEKIKPLPNLDYKIVQGNSLLGVEKNLLNKKIFNKLEELKQVYFNETNPVKKQKYRKQIEELIGKVTRGHKEFDFEVYFSEVFHEKGGFDVVIANPPYGANYEKPLFDKLKSIYKFYDRRNNSASFFIELAQNITTKSGIITYIVPKSLSFSEGWKKTRKLIAELNQLCIVVDVSEAFEEVLLEQIIVLFTKFRNSNNNDYAFYIGEGWNKEINIFGKTTTEKINDLDILPIYITKNKEKIFKKMKEDSIFLSEISRTFRGLPLQSKVSEHGIPVIRGKNISKYLIYGELDKVSKQYIPFSKIKKLNKPKIVSQNIVAHVRNPYDRIIIIATLDREGLLSFDTVMNTILTTNNFRYEFILALLNSTLASWFYYWFVYNRAVRTMHFDTYYIGKLPIRQISLEEQRPIIEIVNRILSLTQSNTGILACDSDTYRNVCATIKEYEKQIDQLVYKLYGLTEEEIRIVEGGEKR